MNIVVVPRTKARVRRSPSLRAVGPSVHITFFFVSWKYVCRKSISDFVQSGFLRRHLLNRIRSRPYGSLGSSRFFGNKQHCSIEFLFQYSISIFTLSPTHIFVINQELAIFYERSSLDKKRVSKHQDSQQLADVEVFLPGQMDERAAEVLRERNTYSVTYISYLRVQHH